MVKTKKNKKKAERIIDNVPKQVEKTEEVVKDFIEELMSKDWKKLLEDEIGKIKGSKKKTKGAKTGISLIAAFAIGYMLGSLRR